MAIIIYVFVLACCLSCGGCRSRGQAPQDQDRQRSPTIQIQKLALTEKRLTLDYQVSSPSENEIWICEDIDVYGGYDVETRIVGEMLLVKCRFNLEVNIDRDEGVLAKYRRVPPKGSHSGRIDLKLPVRNDSPVYDFDEWGKKRKQIFLHGLVLEVGYFEGNLLDMIAEYIEKGKQSPGNEELYVEALELESTQLAKPPSRDIACLYHLWSGLRAEKSARVAIADVDIPCSVAAENK